MTNAEGVPDKRDKRAGPTSCQRVGATVVALFVLSVSTGIAAGNKSTKSFWTGKLDVSVLRCETQCDVYDTAFGIDERGIVRHGMKDTVSYYSYDVFQNDEGLVRHKLVFAQSGGGTEQGRGGEIIDYASGQALVFDPGAWQALRVPLIHPRAISTSLPDRVLLGRLCHGVRSEWRQENGFRNVREEWRLAEEYFKDPLLVVSYGYSTAGELDLIEVRAIRSIEASRPLAPAEFVLPSGMTVSTLDIH